MRRRVKNNGDHKLQKVLKIYLLYRVTTIKNKKMKTLLEETKIAVKVEICTILYIKFKISDSIQEIIVAVNIYTQ